MCKISVIIPVYNVSNYIEECLNSVLNQTFQDYEVICINDGSTDDSFSKLQKFASLDKRFKILSQNNCGVSAARNLGIKQSKGDYIMFLDGDDFYENDTLSIAYNKINQQAADIACFAFKELYQNEFINKLSDYLQKLDSINKHEFKDLLPLQTFCWNKIFKKTFILDNSIEFPDGVKTGEDGAFCYECLMFDPQYTFIDDILYNYRKNRADSATNSAKENISEDLKALKYLFTRKSFCLQSKDKQLLVIDKYLSGIIYYLETFPEYKSNYLFQIRNYFEFLLKHYNYKDLESLKRFQILIKNEEIFELVMSLNSFR